MIKAFFFQYLTFVGRRYFIHRNTKRSEKRQEGLQQEV
ncbi:hypothetical protein APV28_3281 [Comamonas testosteroni]|jgi:hypothetical protein|nr:hypothetical protein APV28_3281 [Comamonas testosteroni]